MNSWTGRSRVSLRNILSIRTGAGHGYAEMFARSNDRFRNVRWTVERRSRVELRPPASSQRTTGWVGSVTGTSLDGFFGKFSRARGSTFQK
jgi:hypothetical protein